MTKPIIAVDIDDVLSLTAENIVAFGNEQYGHSNTLDDFDEHLVNLWGVSDEEAHRRWMIYMNSGVMETYHVVPTAKEVLRRLKQRYRLVAVTSRRDSLRDITRAWLDQHYPGIIEEVVMAGIYGTGKDNAHQLTKGEVLKKVGAAYHIDDQPKHCIGADDAGVTAILYGGYPWNKDVEISPTIVRCDTWKDIEEYFDGRS